MEILFTALLSILAFVFGWYVRDVTTADKERESYEMGYREGWQDCEKEGGLQ